MDADDIRAKSWIALDDHVEAVEDAVEPLFEWSTESYIASGQLSQAKADEDVLVGDIEEHDEKGFVVYLFVEEVFE